MRAIRTSHTANIEMERADLEAAGIEAAVGAKQRIIVIPETPEHVILASQNGNTPGACACIIA